jgi:tetratricopeptide (TPR) repeat protein
MASEKRGIGRKARPSEKEPKAAPKKPSIGRKPPAGSKTVTEQQREAKDDRRHDEAHDGADDEADLDSDPVAQIGATEQSLRDFAGRASKKFTALFNEAKEKATPAARSAAEQTKRIAVDLEGGLDEAFGKISVQARDLMSQGQHTRVRIKFRGRQLTELPIAVVAAAEAASLWWFGPLRLLIGHVVGKSVLDVEFVSNADAHVAEGRAQLADGELEKALAAFDKALSMDRKSAAAWLGRGVALKLRGDKPGAKEAFETAEKCDPHGESGREARRHLDNLVPK